MFKVASDAKGVFRSLAYVEREYILYICRAMNWHRDSACKVLKINRRTLYRKFCEWGIQENVQSEVIANRKHAKLRKAGKQGVQQEGPDSRAADEWGASDGSGTVRTAKGRSSEGADQEKAGGLSEHMKEIEGE